MDIRDYKVGFVGLGYAGLPMAYHFARKLKIVGYDLSHKRISELQSCVDRCGGVSADELELIQRHSALFTTDVKALEQCNFYIICVPTPVDADMQPDFTYLLDACSRVGEVLKKGDIVVFSSTVYPGATEELCVPVLEKTAGLSFNTDFFVGYVPERINPGDTEHTISNTVVVTSGSTPETARIIDEIYTMVLGEGHTYRAGSLKVAEASKVIENSQRDVNIAFVNEVAKVLSAMNISTSEVIDAMNTKWNALGFRPGLVGGHCIGIDPYYISTAARTHGTATQLIDLARRINNSLAEYVAEQVIKHIGERKKDIDNGIIRVLLLGFSFKENVPDVRNSRVYDIYRLLKIRGYEVAIYDPVADVQAASDLYGVELINDLMYLHGLKFNAIVLCVAHSELSVFPFADYFANNGFVYDVKGVLPADNSWAISL